MICRLAFLTERKKGINFLNQKKPSKFAVDLTKNEA